MPRSRFRSSPPTCAGRPLSLTDTVTRRDQRSAQANEEFWSTLDKLEAIMFEQGAQPAKANPGQTAVPLTGDYSTNLPVVTRRRPWGKYIVRALAGFAIFLTLAIGWLALTAPLSKSLLPPTPPSITLLAADGTPIARRGAIIGTAVDAEKLPPHIVEAFLAIEDRRFYSHWGVDPRGIARAVWHNATSDGRNQGGSTITQQLAKNAFLDSDRTVGRKLREVMIAFWLEGWLTKNEIMSRYLSNVYFGDNVYGLQAAAKHYFGRDASGLTVGQAAMLAGLVKAPSKLNPTDNLPGARARAKLVVAAMADAGFLTPREADAVVAAKPRQNIKQALPTGTYFADWVLPAARDQAGRDQDRGEGHDDARPPDADRGRTRGQASGAAPGAGRDRRDASRTAAWWRWSAARITLPRPSTARRRRGGSRDRRSSCSSIWRRCAAE